MEKNTSKQNGVASDVSLLKIVDKKNIKLENIHQRSSSSCTNSKAHDFVKLGKQNTQQCNDHIKLGEINF